MLATDYGLHAGLGAARAGRWSQREGLQGGVDAASAWSPACAAHGDGA